MNTCIVCFGEDNNTDLLEYNHCGLYYIHRECLKKWPHKECIICRKKVIIVIKNHQNNLNFIIKLVAVSICPLIIGLICALIIVYN